MGSCVTAPPAISFRQTVKRFGAITAVDGVTLDIAKGSFTALVGASGSGKSTLLKTINRLIEPTSGEVLCEGKDVRIAAPSDLRRQIGYVFQSIGLFPHMNVAQNIGIGPKIAGDPLSCERLTELLEWVDLDITYADRMPHELSGGSASASAWHGLSRAIRRSC